MVCLKLAQLNIWFYAQGFLSLPFLVGVEEVFWECGAAGVALQASLLPGDPAVMPVRNPRPVAGKGNVPGSGERWVWSTRGGALLSTDRPRWAGV